MKKGLFCTMFVAVLAMGAMSTAAYADTVVFTLSSSTVDVAPGGTATFDATISAPGSNGAPVFLNSDSVTFNLPVGNILDDSGLLSNFVADLNPGDSDTEELFTVTIPAGTLSGLYSGVYELQGGADENALDKIGTVDFTVDVQSPVAATPEPGSWVLLASGMAGAAAVVTRRRFVRA
ncbi:MAG: PEP-CTERM sorting domain-containing protein [Edaphobacter sp.]